MTALTATFNNDTRIGPRSTHTIGHEHGSDLVHTHSHDMTTCPMDRCEFADASDEARDAACERPIVSPQLRDSKCGSRDASYEVRAARCEMPNALCQMRVSKCEGRTANLKERVAKCEP